MANLCGFWNYFCFHAFYIDNNFLENLIRLLISTDFNNFHFGIKRLSDLFSSVVLTKELKNILQAPRKSFSMFTIQLLAGKPLMMS